MSQNTNSMRIGRKEYRSLGLKDSEYAYLDRTTGQIKKFKDTDLYVVETRGLSWIAIMGLIWFLFATVVFIGAIAGVVSFLEFMDNYFLGVSMLYAWGALLLSVIALAFRPKVKSR